MRLSTSLALLGAITGAALAAPVRAQMPPGPSPELKRYDSWLGTWEGSGQWVMDEGAMKGPWTSRATYKKVLGGHWIQEIQRIELGGLPPNYPNVLMFESLLGWDNENQRHIKIEVGNEGTMQQVQASWTPDNQHMTMLVTVNKSHGGPRMERWVTSVQGDEMTLLQEAADGSGPFYKQVWGTMKRIDGEAAELGPRPQSMVPVVPKQMQRIQGMCGAYKNKGWYVMGAGMPKQEFTGRETVTSLYDGNVLHFHMRSDPMAGGVVYEMQMWLSWIEHEQRYDMMFASSMGESGVNHCWLMDKKFVSTSNAKWMGLPTAVRGIVTLGDDGRMVSATSHILSATSDPIQNFGNTYERLKD